MKGSGEIAINASYFAPTYGTWMGVHPAILLGHGEQPDAFPSASRYKHKLILDEQNTTRTLSLCPSQLRDRRWRLAVYNPIRASMVRRRGAGWRGDDWTCVGDAVGTEDYPTPHVAFSVVSLCLLDVCRRSPAPLHPN